MEVGCFVSHPRVRKAQIALSSAGHLSAGVKNLPLSVTCNGDSIRLDIARIEGDC